MKLESIALQLLAVVIVGQVSDGRITVEERSMMRSAGMVLLQVSASADTVVSGEGTANASAPSLHISGDVLATPAKPIPRRHRGSHDAHHAAPGQYQTLWRKFVRIQITTTGGVDSGTIALGCVVVVVVVILGIFIVSESSQGDDVAYKMRKRNIPPRKAAPPTEPTQLLTSDVNTPLHQAREEVDVGPRTVSSAPPPPEERYAGPTTLRSAPLSDETYAGAGHAAVANVPPASIKGKFLQGSPLSSGENLEHVPQSLPPAQTGSRPGSQSNTQNSYLVQEGRQSSPHIIERLPMASTGVTPVGSAPKLPDSLGNGAMAGGVMVGTNQVQSKESSAPTLGDDSKQVGKPPPVCKELVLPHCEAWFAVAFDKLDSTQNGDFDLYGLSGKPLLRASLQTGPGLQKLSISMKPAKSPTLGCIQTVTTTNGPAKKKKKMEIRSKNDEFYGDFVSTGGMRYVVNRPGSTPSELVSVYFDKAKNQLNVTSSIDGSLLAHATRCTTSEMNEIFRNKVHLEVRVNPGVDAVLILLCVLAVVVFTVGGPT